MTTESVVQKLPLALLGVACTAQSDFAACSAECYASAGFSFERVPRSYPSELGSQLTQKLFLAKACRGQLDGLIGAPGMATFSRLQFGPQSVPNRNRECPLGVAARSPEETKNLELEAMVWDFAISLSVILHKRGRPFLLLAPEDLGDSGHGAQASPWSSEELNYLISLEGTFTGAFYGCTVALTAEKRPMRITSNVKGLQKYFHLGPPVFAHRHDNKRRYVGPLPVVCQCGQGHGRAQAGHGPIPEFVLTKTLIRKLLETFIDPSITLRERETKTKETWKDIRRENERERERE